MLIKRSRLVKFCVIIVSLISDLTDFPCLQLFVFFKTCFSLEKCRIYPHYGRSNIFFGLFMQAGVTNGGWGWGAAFIDVDNNGFLDIIMTSGNYV